MRIGLLIYDLRSGGAERVLCKWSELLSEGNEVILYTFDGNSTPVYSFNGNLNIIDLPSRGRNKIKQILVVLKRILKLRSMIKKDKIDLLISFCSTANFPAMFQKTNKLASIRVYSEYFSYRRIYRFLLKYTKTELVVQTNRLKEEILNDVGSRYTEKIYVMANPVDTKMILKKTLENPDESFLKRIKGKKVICFTGSFKKSKNHWNLIKSFNIVHLENPDTVLVLIGGDGELEEEIHEMVKNSALCDAVIFIGKTTNPFMYEKKADLFVLPSIFEGIPNVLIEALAVGLPVISTDCPSGPREILCLNADYAVQTKGMEMVEYGILVEQFSEKTDFDINNISIQNQILANAMKMMIMDDKLNLHYREMAIMRAKEYDLREYRKQLEDLVDGCVKKRR